jgi:hypothetical protein
MVRAADKVIQYGSIIRQSAREGLRLLQGQADIQNQIGELRWMVEELRQVEAEQSFSQPALTLDQTEFVLLSPLYPQRTGVAEHNAETFGRFRAGVAVHGQFPVASHSRNSMIETLGSLTPVDANFVMQAARQRIPIVVSLGNSNDNFYILDLALKIRGLHPDSPIALHLHDGFVWNIARFAARSMGLSLRDFADGVHHIQRLGKNRGSSADNAHDAGVVRHTPRTGQSSRAEQASQVAFEAEMLAHDFTGIRVLDELLRPEVILVNTDRAAKLAHSNGIDRDRVRTLFLPLVDRSSDRVSSRADNSRADNARRDSTRVDDVRADDLDNRPIRIGLFGVPCPAKLTEETLHAIDVVARRTSLNLHVWMVGFGARAYGEGLDSRLRTNLICREPMTRVQFLDTMESMDVAIQLRAQDTGESSGVLADLLSYAIPTLISPVGQFSNYFEVFDVVDTARPLDGAIEDLVNRARAGSPPNVGARQRLLDQHSAARFERLVLDVLRR